MKTKMRITGNSSVHSLNSVIRFRSNIKSVAKTLNYRQAGIKSLNRNTGPTIEEHSRRVKNVVPSNYERAIRYLQSSVHNIGHQSIIFQQPNSKEKLKAIPVNSEVFSAALIYDVIAQLPGLKASVSVLPFIESHMSQCGFFQYFSNRPHNDDVDTTSVCIYALLQGQKIDLKLATSAAKCVSCNTITEATSSNSVTQRNIIKVFFPPDVPFSASATAVDEGTMANSLRLLYFLGMENTALDTEDHLLDWINDSERFHKGSLYYSSDVMLFFLSNCVLLSEKFRSRFQHILTVRLEERIGMTNAPLDLSMRIITAHNLGHRPMPVTASVLKPQFLSSQNLVPTLNQRNIKVTKDLKKEAELLCEKQKLDGSWELDPIFRFYTIYFSNRTAVTAFGAKALLVSGITV